MPPQGYATYPGVNAVLSARYTLAHGITPGLIEFEIAPQDTDVAAIGNAVFYYGTTTLTLLDCKADAASMVRGSNGTLVSFTVQDRRWRWRYGEMYGHYNQRDANGVVRPDTEKTPQQLAALLLTQMGEACDLSEIPNDARDEAEWVGENPAEELQALLERFGCTIVLRPDQSIAIHRVGYGAGLPVNEYLLEQQVDTNPPDVPAVIRVVGAPMRFQARLALEAVAEDVDGRIRPVNQLSYKPQVSAGWGREGDYFASLTDDTQRRLALRDVFRLYRIRDRDSESPIDVVTVPGAGTVSHRRQILPLAQGLVQTGKDPDGQWQRKPERILGLYFIRNSGSPENSTTSAHYEYKGRFQVDSDRGFVRFEEPVTKWNSSSKVFEAADIKLECSFAVRSLQIGSPYRYTYTIPTNAFAGSGVDVVRREEIVREHYEDYPSNASSPTWRDKIPTAELDAQGAYYANGRLGSYITSQGATGKYAGLQAFATDGAIVQITWEVGASGTMTTVSRLAEPHPYLPPFKARRIQEGNRKQRWRAVQQQKERR